MTQDLLKALLKRREVRVKVGDHTFIARRFSDAEAAELDRDGAVTFIALAQKFVIGWEDVTVNDVIGDGTMDPAIFSPSLWHEWCADRPDVWKPVAEALLASYKDHESARDDTRKN